MGKFAKIVRRRLTKHARHRVKSGPGSKTNVKKNFHYPERTEGSKHARELRERSNQITDKERQGLFERAMQRLYGARVKATIGTGH